VREAHASRALKDAGHGVGRDEASSSSLCQEFLGGCALHPLWGKCDRNVCAIPHHIERVIRGCPASQLRLCGCANQSMTGAFAVAVLGQ